MNLRNNFNLREDGKKAKKGTFFVGGFKETGNIKKKKRKPGGEKAIKNLIVARESARGKGEGEREKLSIRVRKKYDQATNPGKRRTFKKVRGGGGGGSHLCWGPQRVKNKGGI